MDISGKEAQNVDVGGRLRTLREERGVSMRALARRSGLSANALSMIERALTSPSVSTLNKLANALEVPITAFFRQEPPRNNIVFRKADERVRAPFLRGVWEGLGGEQFVGRVEPFHLTLEPGGTSGPHGMLHTGHEFVFCIRGQLEYEVNGQRFILEAGDSLIFAAQLSHRWRNPGKSVTNAIIVLSGFEESERPGEYHLSSPMDEGELDESDEEPGESPGDTEETAEI
jgi:transcriptional regulator with XRE-family HTH domain